MSATPFHNQDPFDLNTQKSSLKTERAIYGQTGGIGTDGNIGALFHERFDQIANCVLADDVMETDHWKMKGITMVALADRLGTDHGTISRWRRQGILPASVEHFLMACPTRPRDWQARIDKAFNARHRGAFMNVAKYLYDKLPGHSPGDGDSLLEMHAECLFDILDERNRWEAACASNDFSMAEEIVESMCDLSDRQILPVWYNKEQNREVLQLISRLHGNNRLAFKYLCLLQRHWEGVFILTRAATEGMGWL
jgi:transcriptional regulator with XRE-family HTH domain